MNSIKVNTIKTIGFVEDTHDVKFLVNFNIYLYVNLKKEATLTLLEKINPPYLLRFDDEVKRDKVIPSSNTFEIVIESTLCPDKGSRNTIVLNASIEY